MDQIYPPFGIQWIGPYEDISGISHINRSVALSAFGLGLSCRSVSPFARGTWSHLEALLPLKKQETLRFTEQAAFPLNPQNYFSVHSYPPHYLRFPLDQIGGHPRAHISYSLFETNKIPANWPEVLNSPEVMEVWVPCKFQLESYRRGGIEPRKLKCVPHGVDIQEFTPKGLRMKFLEEDPFMFLSVMDLSPRKGPDILLKAYFETFQEATPKDVLLVLKAYNGGGGESERQKIEQQIMAAKKEANSTAPVLFIGGFLGDEQMPMLHRSVHAYVNTSRGEGWNFPALQSMACGVPCLIPKHSSHLDFGTDQNCLWIDATEKEITDPKFLALDARFYGHSWWEPSVESVKKQMRWAFEHREEMTKKGAQAREDVKRLSWENSLRSIVTQLAKFVN